MLTFGNLFTEPKVHILEDVALGTEERRAVLAVEGLLCRICAARVRRALEGLPYVVSATYLPNWDSLEVLYRSTEARTNSLREAVLSTVVAPDLRRLLGRVKGPPGRR